MGSCVEGQPAPATEPALAPSLLLRQRLCLFAAVPGMDLVFNRVPHLLFACHYVSGSLPLQVIPEWGITAFPAAERCPRLRNSCMG